MSWPPELSTSSVSPCSELTALGTSRMFSRRRSAVTVTTVSSPVAGAGVWAGVWADAPTWIKANATAAAIGCRAAFFWGIAGLRWAMGSGRGFEQTGRSGRSGPK